MAIKKTRFGDVDASALDEVCDSFDTSRLHHTIQQLEIIGNYIGDMRRNLHRLYDITLKLTEEDAFMDTPPTVECKLGDEIWALAEDLSMSMTEWPEQIEAVQEILDELVKLAPDPDEYDYITNKAYE